MINKSTFIYRQIIFFYLLIVFLICWLYIKFSEELKPKIFFKGYLECFILFVLTFKAIFTNTLYMVSLSKNIKWTIIFIISIIRWNMKIFNIYVLLINNILCKFNRIYIWSRMVCHSQYLYSKWALFIEQIDICIVTLF